MDTPDTSPFELVSQRLGGLPLVNHFWEPVGKGSRPLVDRGVGAVNGDRAT